MPAIQVHLAIANRYIEKHEIEDKEEFLKGSIAPDFQMPKDKSHYSMPHPNKEDLIEGGKTKTDINRFLAENKIKTDYNKGILLHLLTDKIFFTEFFDEEYYKKTSYLQFCSDLYTSYSTISDYIIKKYNIVFSKELKEKIEENIRKSRKEKNVDSVHGNEIIDKDKLDKFIERMSDIDLEKYYKTNLK